MMTTSLWDTVWARARAGQHTVVVGPTAIPSTPDDLLVLWVHCNAPWTTGGPLDEVLHRVSKLVGDDPVGVGQAPRPQVEGLRSRLFDETVVQTIDARLVEVCNRLASWSDHHVVLGFDAVDDTDEATLAILTQILTHPGWLQLPLVLSMTSVLPGPVAELVGVIQRVAGNDAIIDLSATASPAQPVVPFDWASLPPDVLRVLRAGSVLGTGVEAGLIAQLLDEPVGMVLERLQQATDAGLDLEDLGEGRFLVPPETVQSLQTQMLPSLRDHWHTKLGAILSEPYPRRDEFVTPPDQKVELNDRANETVVDREPPEIESSPSVKPAEDTPSTASSRRADLYAQMFEPATPGEAGAASLTTDETVPLTTGSTPGARPTPSPHDDPVMFRPRTDQARAATHFQAAGQTEAAVEQYLAAARDVASHGDSRRAYAMVQKGLSLLDKLPPSERRSLLRTQLYIELGREQWQSSVVGSPFTLQDAQASLEWARGSLPDAPPPEILGQLASITAGVCYDLGDLTSLQHALNELTVVSRQLMEMGDSTLAASLLNDLAAVYVRLGDPVRATHLLSESRGLFESVLRVCPDETDALEELAASEHLLARLALHTPIRAGREDEAYAISLEHAQAAENAYERLNQPWAVARVWETIGRLVLEQGHPEAAQGRLMSALELQKRLGDVTGLARTTAALADLCISAGEVGEAATLLSDSVALNFEKGSPIGLAFNRRAFYRLKRAVSQADGGRPEPLPRLLADVESRLVQAEAVFGQIALPGERDPLSSQPAS